MNIKKTGVEKLDAEAASKNLYGITVPIITAETTEEEGRNNPRAPFYAVYKFILDDLASAEELLSDYQRPTQKLALYPSCPWSDGTYVAGNGISFRTLP